MVLRGAIARRDPAADARRCCAAPFAASMRLTLLVESLRHAARERGQARVHEQQRDRDAEAEHRRDHRLADAVGHEPRIARARSHDRAERDDHADDRADEAEQRTGGDGQPQERLEALEPGTSRSTASEMRSSASSAFWMRLPSPRNASSTRPSGLFGLGSSRFLTAPRLRAA